MPKPNLKTKTALITGGVNGIGRAITLRLVKDGFRVIVNYKQFASNKIAQSLATTLKNTGKDYLIIRADISKSAEVKSMIKKIKEKFGSLDVIINNAGINQAKELRHTSDADIKNIISTNLYGGIYVVRAALPLLKKSPSARIIFISSATAFLGSKNRIGYVTSKSAILGLHKALALDLAPHILVNSVVPGYVDTQMFRKFNRKPIADKIKRILVGRIGKPDDIAGVVSFLCSEDASYITGQSIHVNGGLFFT